MMTARWNFKHMARIALATGTCAIAVAGCGVPETSSEEAIATFALTSRAGIKTYAVVPDQLKIAAAQVFRDLSVVAETETLPKLRHDVRDAIDAEKAVHRSLSAARQSEARPNLAKLASAARTGDRGVIALRARELMRLIIEDLSPAAEKQAAYARLDYAQLAAQASLDRANPDWALVDAAIRLATSSLGELNVQEHSHTSRHLDARLATLTAAVTRRNRAAAIRALKIMRVTFDADRARFDGPLPDQALTSSRRLSAQLPASGSRICLSCRSIRLRIAIRIIGIGPRTAALGLRGS